MALAFFRSWTLRSCRSPNFINQVWPKTFEDLIHEVRVRGPGPALETKGGRRNWCLTPLIHAHHPQPGQQCLCTSCLCLSFLILDEDSYTSVLTSSLSLWCEWPTDLNTLHLFLVFSLHLFLVIARQHSCSATIFVLFYPSLQKYMRILTSPWTSYEYDRFDI